MALRMMVYVGLLYQDLIKTEKISTRSQLPPVFPLVIYNGLPRWKAPMHMSELVSQLPGTLQRYQPSCATSCWMRAARRTWPGNWRTTAWPA